MPKDKDIEMIKEIIDLTANIDDPEFIEQIIHEDPKFIIEVIDLTRENDPEIIKEIIDLAKNNVKVQVFDLTNAYEDPEFIKEVIDLTKTLILNL